MMNRIIILAFVFGFYTIGLSGQTHGVNFNLLEIRCKGSINCRYYKKESKKAYTGIAYQIREDTTIMIFNLESGLLEGDFITKHLGNGQILEKGQFSKGKYNGEYQKYDLHGKLIVQGNYKNGEKENGWQIFEMQNKDSLLELRHDDEISKNPIVQIKNDSILVSATLNISLIDTLINITILNKKTITIYADTVFSIAAKGDSLLITNLKQKSTSITKLFPLPPNIQITKTLKVHELIATQVLIRYGFLPDTFLPYYNLKSAVNKDGAVYYNSATVFEVLTILEGEVDIRE